MANTFTLTITAVDKATATVRGVNAAIGRLTAPIARVGAAGKDLGREMGIGKLAGSFRHAGREAGELAEKVRRIVTPVAAIAGLAGAGAIAAMATEWGRAGSSLVNSSRAIGIGTARLQEYEGAARMVGMAQGEATNALQAFGMAMSDALNSRNIGASQMLSVLGVKLAKTKTGAVDLEQAFSDVQDVLRRYEGMPQTQQTIAQALGVEQLLPLLRASKTELAGYMQAARKAHAILPAEDAKKFDQVVQGLDLSLLGLRNTLMLKLAPAVTPLITRFSDWLNGIDPDEAGKRIDSFANRIDGFVQRIGGWKTVGIGLATFFGGRLLLSVGATARAFGRLALGIGRFAVMAGSIAVGGALPLLVRGLGLVAGAIGAIGFGPVIAGVALLAGAVYLIYEYWTPLKKFIGDLLDGIETRLSGLAKRIRDMQNPVKQWTEEELKLGGFEAAPNQKWQPGQKFGRPGSGAGENGGSPAGIGAGQSPYLTPPGRTPLGLSLNNPGNMRSWGATPVDPSGFARFGSMAEGLSAAVGNMIAKAKLHHFDTLEQLIGGDAQGRFGWAPARDHNNVPAYVADMAKRTGLDPKQKLDFTDPEVERKILPALIGHEQGRQPFSADEIDRAIRARMGWSPGQRSDATPAGGAPAQGNVQVTVHFENAPAGVRAKVDSDGSVQSKLRIGYAMPSAATP